LSEHDKSRGESFGTSFAEVVRSNTWQYAMIAMLIMIWVFFYILTGGIFMRPRNLSNILIQMVHIGILANGMALVIITGGLDLSVGSGIIALGAFAGWLMVRRGFNPVFAVIITLFAGFVVGCWHGFWVAFRRVPAVIVTFASMVAFRGVSQMITMGAVIGDFKPGFKAIGQAYIPQILLLEKPYLSTTEVLSIISVIAFIISNNLGIPIPIMILLSVTGIFILISNRTPFGRHVYAIGDNIEAARLSGVNVRSTMMRIYMSMGILSAVAALVYTARGNTIEIDTIAACVIGGISTVGGIGSVFGAVIGTLIIASLDNGLALMNLSNMYQLVVKGLVLLFAVWVDIVNRKK